MFLYSIVLVGFISWVLTYVLRRYALKKSLMDIPNARSSHSAPTPRGGGVAIVVSFLVAVALAGAVVEDAVLPVFALIGSGLAIALVGFLDDHGHIAARWRLLVHFVAAIWAVFWLNGLPPFDLFGTTVNPGWLGYAIAVFFLVWMLNLYNFMDGIDGIASVEAITVCLGAALIYFYLDQPTLIAAPVLLAAAVVGFLWWNFPPARIFMGDAGSGFLGIVIGILALEGGWASPKLLWVWLILLGVFLVDATYTLLRRLLRGDKVYEAHRSHAYQYASREMGAHRPVTVAVALINVCWLLPIAFAVALDKLTGASGLILAYAPLVILAIRFRAGAIERAAG